MNKDLTVGKPASVLWQYSLPLFGSILFQQLYNTADTLIVGRFLGDGALAAVSSSGPLIFLLISFFVGQVMRATRGKANPALVNELLAKKLAG